MDFHPPQLNIGRALRIASVVAVTLFLAALWRLPSDVVIAAAQSPLYSLADGAIAALTTAMASPAEGFCPSDPTANGMSITQRVSGGWVSYQDLTAISVEIGDRVAPDDILGSSGASSIPPAACPWSWSKIIDDQLEPPFFEMGCDSDPCGQLEVAEGYAGHSYEITTTGTVPSVYATWENPDVPGSYLIEVWSPALSASNFQSPSRAQRYRIGYSGEWSVVDMAAQDDEWVPLGVWSFPDGNPSVTLVSAAYLSLGQSDLYVENGCTGVVIDAVRFTRVCFGELGAEDDGGTPPSCS